MKGLENFKIINVQQAKSINNYKNANNNYKNAKQKLLQIISKNPSIWTSLYIIPCSTFSLANSTR